MANHSKYKPEMCDQVKELMATGLSRKATATEMNISYNTFLSYIDKYEDFADAVSKADAVSQADVLVEVFWEEKYMQGALGVNKDVSPAMLIMYMKTVITGGIAMSRRLLLKKYRRWTNGWKKRTGNSR